MLLGVQQSLNLVGAEREISWKAFPQWWLLLQCSYSSELEISRLLNCFSLSGFSMAAKKLVTDRVHLALLAQSLFGNEPHIYGLGLLKISSLTNHKMTLLLSCIILLLHLALLRKLQILSWEHCSNNWFYWFSSCTSPEKWYFLSWLW